MEVRSTDSIFHKIKQTMSALQPTHRRTRRRRNPETAVACPTGLFVDGVCDRSAQSGFPAAGRHAYYTYYSCVAVVVALLLFLCVLAPLACRQQAISSPVAYIVAAFVLGAAVNSIAVFMGAQGLALKARFGEHLETMDDERITMTLTRYKLRSRAEVLLHSIPAVVAVLLLIGLAFVRFVPGTNFWLIAGVALLWIAAGATAYALAPIQKRMHGEPETKETRQTVRGLEKLDFVYGKTNGLALLITLFVVATIGAAVVSLKLLKKA
jgi:hypothetical protein